MSAIIEIGFDARKVEAGLSGVEGKLKTFGASVQKHLPNMAGMLGFAGVGATLGTAAAAVRQALASAGDLADTAVKLGESAESLQRVQYAAELSGTSLDSVTSSMLRLEKALGDVENKSAAEALENMGLSAQRLASLPIEERMVALSEAFQKARATGTGYNDILALMGKSAGDLIPLLSSSTEELRKMMDAAPVVGEEITLAMAQADDALDKFSKKASQIFSEGVGTNVLFLRSIGNLFRGQSWVDAFATRDDISMKGAEEQRKREEAAASRQKNLNAALAKEQEDSRNKVIAKLEVIHEREVELLEPAQRLIALQDMLAAKIDKMRSGPGGAMFEASIQGMKDYAAALGQAGGAGSEVKAEELQKILDLQTKIQSTESLIAKTEADAAAATEAAEAQKQDAIRKTAELKARERAEQEQATRDLMMEVMLLQAKAQGQENTVKQLEREQEIRRRTQEIMSRTGMGADQARSVATSMVDMQARADQRAQRDQGPGMPASTESDKSGRIRGYSFARQGGAYERQDHLYGAGAKFRDNQANLLRDQAANNGREKSTPGQDTNTAQTALQTIQQILTTLQGGAT